MRLNGLEFHVEVDGRGPPLVLLHGFTGSVRSWDIVRPALTSQATVVSIDLIGHGRSAAPAEADRYSLDWSARDLLALLDQLNLEAVDLLGYSMGGRVALHFAAHAPDRVRWLCLESASPGIEEPAERAQRVIDDAALAERIEQAGIEAFVDEWEALPLLQPAPQVTDAVRRGQRAQRLDNRPVGLANSLRGMGAGQQAPLWTGLPGLHMPVLLVVGARDSRYGRLAERMRAQCPAAELVVVPEAGHTVHLDQPEQFSRHVAASLANKLTPCARRC